MFGSLDIFKKKTKRTNILHFFKLENKLHSGWNLKIAFSHAICNAISFRDLCLHFHLVEYWMEVIWILVNLFIFDTFRTRMSEHPNILNFSLQGGTFQSYHHILFCRSLKIELVMWYLFLLKPSNSFGNKFQRLENFQIKK